MLPIPHIMLFVPAGVLACLAVAVTVMQFAIRFVAPVRVEPARPTARIFYFARREITLASASKLGGRPVPPQRYRALDGG